MRKNWIGCYLTLATVIWVSAEVVWSQKFRQDDPLWEDPDYIAIPQPTDREIGKAFDLFQKTFTKPPHEGSVQAANTNTLGEVPDCSWFTNRMSRRQLTIEELVQGPNQENGPPDLSKPWVVVGAKVAGITPGLRIQDCQGEVYFLKFDPLHWPQMCTSAEQIGTKFFYALGYNVPENYLVHWDGRYELDTSAEVLWPSGLRTRISRSFVDDILKAVPRREDGTMHVLASHAIEGKGIGPFDFQGTRPDDPNDIFLHQDRLELRGYRVFCAWLNHNDSDAVNTFDTYVTDEEGYGWVKHYLIDFGTILGSGAVQPHARRVGHEYYIEFSPSLKAAATLGIWDRPWRKIKYPDFTSIGRFESEHFQPEKWKPDYPNPAFEKMLLQDAFWATRSVMRFSDEAIRAIVKTGMIEEPGAEDYLVQTLIERRDKIVRHYLSQINPLDNFRVIPEGDRLVLGFDNLGQTAKLASGCRYRYRWFRFTNQAEKLSDLEVGDETDRPAVPVPENSDSEFLMVRIQSVHRQLPHWESEIDVYLRIASDPYVVGIERAHP